MILAKKKQRTMKVNRTLVKAIACLAVGGSIAAHAQAIKTWTGGDGNFFDPSHWDTGTIPGTDPTDIAEIRNGSTATISTADGAHTFGAIRLGPTQDSTESGHVIMNGGRLNLGGTSGDPKAVIGFSASPSSFIMNGGTIYFDGPDTGQLNTNFKGVNELDWEVGEKGIGLFEMHNDAVFHGSDDLKVAENAAGNGTVLIDGNAHLSVGSGISISAGGTHEQLMTIAGHAVVDSGNSMGAGDPAGGTDEGYLTMATGGGLSKLIIQENGVLNIRRLTAREGTSTIIVKDHGQFNIFDVLNGKGGSVTPPDRPAETGPNSTYPSTAATATLTLQDDAVMTVNSEPASGPVQGLGISSPRDPGNAGGTGILIVKDRASFRVEQNLYLGTGANPDTSDGTLEVVGPGVSVSIGGNLNMAVDTDGNIAGTDPDTQLPRAGKATLSAVITGVTHASVNVTGTARIAQGRLKVATSGFTPTLGTTYTLIKGGTVDGTFAYVDTSGAQLPSGLGWTLIYSADKVELKVVTGAGRPDDNGAIVAKTGTIYVNPLPNNNGNTESLGVAVAANGNVIVGWEDDDDALQDYEAVWTMFDTNGVSITPEVQINSIDPAYAGQSITSKYMSYFFSDKSPTPGRASWGPKIKPNFFGNGLGMGGTSFDIGLEIPEMAPINNNAAGENAGDFPTVQLLDNTGAPTSIVSFSDGDAEPDGDIRIGDWDYLGNGNILIVGEDRQDESTRLGTTADRKPVYKVVSSTGQEVKALSLVSEVPPSANSEFWHGSAVTQNGFAIRFLQDGTAWIRLFDNSGNPVSTNIDIAAATGQPGIQAVGGRGEDMGFSGNGKDAYVYAVIGADTNGVSGLIVSVFNADGTVRYSRNATAGFTPPSGRVHAAMDPNGRVVAVFSAPLVTGGTPALQGVFLDPTGQPVGGPFLVSESENPLGSAVLQASGPRVSWQKDVIAVVWQSSNAGVIIDDAPQEAAALRIFTAPSAGGGNPTLVVQRNGNSITISWQGTGFKLQTSPKLPATAWTDIATTGNSYTTSAAAGTAFFRLINQ